MTGGEGAASSVHFLISDVIAVVFVVYVVVRLLMRPKLKEKERVEAMLKKMQVGDVVITTGGFYGILIDITDEDVIVEFGSNPNCRIPMRKSAIEEVEFADDKAGNNG